MARIRSAVAGIALGSALLVHQVRAAQPATPPPTTPPAEWAQYIAAVRKADAIADDEARCKAYPDPPGNQWRAGAADGRCTLLRAPAWSLDRIDTLLATPEGVAELERGFAALLKAHYSDQAQREQIFIAFQVFDDSRRAGDIAQRWLALAPESPFANVAAGSYFGTSGWEARGTAFASKTSEDKFQRMSDYFAKALPLYMKALEIEPRLSVACYKLNAIGRQSVDALQAYATSQCLKVDPDSYYVAWEQIISAQPKWGGSDERLRHAVAYAAARTERNPILGALLGEAAGYRPANADDYGEVVDELVAAARMGPSGTLMAQAGRGYWVKHDPWPAIAWYSQATRFWPQNARYRYSRANVLFHSVGDPAWAQSDLQIAVREEPENPDYNFLLGMATEAVEGPVAARPSYKRAMAGQGRQWAMERYCATYMIPRIEKGADACTRSLVEEFPEFASAWQMRSWALLEGGDRDGAVAAAARFKSLLLPGSPGYQSALEQLKQFDVALKQASMQPAGSKGARK